MKNHWLDKKKLSIAVIERDGNEIRFTLSNSHVWKFSQPHKGVLEYMRIYPLMLALHNFELYREKEVELCREKAWEIFNGEIDSSKQV